MADKRIEKTKKDFDRLTFSIVVMAIFLLSYGLYHYLYLGTVSVTHPKFPQPSLSNGSEVVFVGIILLILALYRMVRRKKLIEQVNELKKSKFK
ncbi:hypothetical protein [Flagellimonas sediminis]|uniref:Uncharacterized protein n=1 Tax=Flagellimonas sediminis TaxID=2696468 RepID=A0A6I5KNL7_9FLAO|nr:hypothetical protein [Allomuricauda sediminis]NDV42097.1 hypothetical protein [Allomuricauda sediminis]